MKLLQEKHGGPDDLPAHRKRIKYNFVLRDHGWETMSPYITQFELGFIFLATNHVLTIAIIKVSGASCYLSTEKKQIFAPISVYPKRLTTKIIGFLKAGALSMYLSIPGTRVMPGT